VDELFDEENADARLASPLQRLEDGVDDHRCEAERHLVEEHELFADALVTLAAYSADQIKQITAISKGSPGSRDNILQRVHKAHESILRPSYKIDLTQKRISSSWRVSYLTGIIHFFKLRCAILDNAGV